MIISEVAQLSYRDRARVACVSKECHRIADSDESYRGQYIRDFGHLPQDLDSFPYWTFRPQMWFHTSAEQGSEPPKYWEFRAVGNKVEYYEQERSWKRAYIRSHNWKFPHDIYTILPALPYRKRHVDIEANYRLRACQSPESFIPYLHLHERFYCPPKCFPEKLLRAMWHGVSFHEEMLLMQRGWVLCRSVEEPPLPLGKLVRGHCLQCSDILKKLIPERNQKRQEELRGATVGARPGMAQVPIEFET